MKTKTNFRIPGPTLAGNAKMAQFRAGFLANAGTLGFDTADMDAVDNAATDFDTAYNNAEAAKLAARFATQSKLSQFQTSSEVIREFAQAVKNSPLATDEILEACGFVPSPTPAGPVVPPSDLTVKPNSDGTCLLKWKRNGNPTNTVYIVEAQIGASSTWTVISAESKLSFRDVAATPGIQRVYRVKARRKNITSPASPSATIYPGGTSESVVLEAA